MQRRKYYIVARSAMTDGEESGVRSRLQRLTFINRMSSVCGTVKKIFLELKVTVIRNPQLSKFQALPVYGHGDTQCNTPNPASMVSRTSPLLLHSVTLSTVHIMCGVSATAIDRSEGGRYFETVQGRGRTTRNAVKLTPEASFAFCARRLYHGYLPAPRRISV